MPPRRTRSRPLNRSRTTSRSAGSRAKTASATLRMPLVDRVQELARTRLALHDTVEVVFQAALPQGWSLPAWPGQAEPRRERALEALGAGDGLSSTPAYRATCAIAAVGLRLLDRIDPLNAVASGDWPELVAYLSNSRTVAKDLRDHLMRILEPTEIDDSVVQSLRLAVESPRLRAGIRAGVRASKGRKPESKSKRGRLREFLVANRGTWFDLPGLAREGRAAGSPLHGLTKKMLRDAGDGLVAEFGEAFQRDEGLQGFEYRAR